MIMPGTRAYAYVGNPIDIVWEYFPNTDNVTFPRNNFVFYYKKKGDTDWKDIAAIPKGNITKNSYRWTPSEQLLKDTRYELLILVDNVSAVLNGPGNKPSCWAPGFPVGNYFFLKISLCSGVCSLESSFSTVRSKQP
jgi:hypothetical protein